MHLRIHRRRHTPQRSPTLPLHLTVLLHPVIPLLLTRQARLRIRRRRAGRARLRAPRRPVIPRRAHTLAQPDTRLRLLPDVQIQARVLTPPRAVRIRLRQAAAVQEATRLRAGQFL